jgi:hypothetical protein
LPRQAHVGGESRVDKLKGHPWKVIHRLGQRYPEEGPFFAKVYWEEERRKGKGGAIHSFADQVRQWVNKRYGELETWYHAELQVATWCLASNAFKFFFQNDPYVACRLQQGIVLVLPPVRWTPRNQKREHVCRARPAQYSHSRRQIPTSNVGRGQTEGSADEGLNERSGSRDPTRHSAQVSSRGLEVRPFDVGMAR